MCPNAFLNAVATTNTIPFFLTVSLSAVKHLLLGKVILMLINKNHLIFYDGNKEPN